MDNSLVLNKFLSLGIEAIIFDCDGVLVDTEGLKYTAWQRALEEYGIHGFSLTEHLSMIGGDGETMIRLLSEKMNQQLPESIIFRKREIYAEIKDQIKIIPAMIKIVKQLYNLKDALHIKLGLASGDFRKNIHHNLEIAGLSDLFEVILSGKDSLSSYTDPEGTNKPKPYIYIEAAKQLGVSPSHSIAIEDTPIGIQAAKGAGMRVIAVPNVYSTGGDFSQADYVYTGEVSFEKFMECIISCHGEKDIS